MEVKIKTEEVIPALSRSLDNHLAYLAIIEDVFPCGPNSLRVDGDLKTADRVRVQIKNVAGGGFGGSGQVYTAAEFKRFSQLYSLFSDEALKGLPVISVYSKDMGQMLQGLIPLTDRSKIKLS